METIRDRLSVGEQDGRHLVIYHGEEGAHVVCRHSNEDDAWGIVALVIEYVERHRYDDQAAIWAALEEWDQARELAGLAPEQDAQDARYQDHHAAMAAR